MQDTGFAAAGGWKFVQSKLGEELNKLAEVPGLSRWDADKAEDLVQAVADVRIMT